MVAADIVDDAEIRAIAGEGPVRLARLGDRRAILGPGREPAGDALADPRGAADDGGGPAAGLDEPRHQAGHRALAARPADRHARTAGIDQLGQKSGTREHGDPERARRPPLGRLRLDGRRVHEAVEARADRRAIVRHERDAFAAQQGRGLQHQPLVEGPVGPLHAVPARAHEPGQRIHPGPGHAGEVVVKGNPSVGHWLPSLAGPADLGLRALSPEASADLSIEGDGRGQVLGAGRAATGLTVQAR